jgi:hypothetical protein
MLVAQRMDVMDGEVDADERASFSGVEMQCA